MCACGIGNSRSAPIPEGCYGDNGSAESENSGRLGRGTYRKVAQVNYPSLINCFPPPPHRWSPATALTVKRIFLQQDRITAGTNAEAHPGFIDSGVSSFSPLAPFHLFESYL